MQDAHPLSCRYGEWQHNQYIISAVKSTKGAQIANICAPFAPVLPFFFFCRNLRLLGFTRLPAPTAQDRNSAASGSRQQDHRQNITAPTMSARTASTRPRVPVLAAFASCAPKPLPSGVASTSAPLPDPHRRSKIRPDHRNGA